MEGDGSGSSSSSGGGDCGKRICLKLHELGLNYSASVHPLRPHAEDCSFYVRTGTCRFGPKCKYNHPVSRPILKVDDDDEEEEEEDGSDGQSDKSSQIACKFYPTTVGCKNGESCKFIHSKSDSGIAIPELNFIGLPIRLGEKECPFYMRTGLCAYGTDCRYHHPDPTIEGSDTYNSNLNAEAVGYFSSTAGYVSHFSVSSSVQASWPSYTISNDCVSYMDNFGSYTPTASFYPEGRQQTTEWNGYQVSQYSQEKKPPSVSAGNTKMDKVDTSKKVEESPEHPVEAKTPVASPPKKETCDYNELGLPLRPGEKVCWDFENYGVCRLVCTCPFDHPMDKRSPNVPTHLSNTFVLSDDPEDEDGSWDYWYDD